MSPPFYCEVLADGKNLGEELVAHGLARIYAPKTSRRDGTRATTVINLLKNLELIAREQKRGVWNSAEFPRADEVTVTRKDSPARAITEDSPLDLNSASYEGLQELPGIGKKLAERIIAHRP
jgi:DNA uptake protein ComE-like DNA-binding protein